jgi:TonB family protein
VSVSHRVLICFAAVFVTAGTFAQSAPRVDAVKTASAQSSGAEAAYPETPEGLKKLLEDVFEAEKAGDTAKSERLYASMAIPDHAAWFVKTFGEEEGARLDAKYNGLEDAASSLKRRVEAAIQRGQLNIIARIFLNPEDIPVELQKAFLAAMTSAMPLYHGAVSSGPEDKTRVLLGDFVYVDGGFRYVDLEVMRTLSGSPPMRVKLGGDVAKPKLIHRVDPTYPAEASRQGIQGTVKLHVVLAKDGSVRQMDVVSGNPLLAQAAMDSVKQWRYQPTLLNDEPVEVVTEVEVFFGRRK